MEKYIKKIVVIGPESTGKSSLCKALADHYKTIWVKEFAREYLEKNGASYTFENLYDIAGGQIREEEEGVRKITTTSKPDNVSPLFIDTDLHVIKIWSEFVFNKCDNRLLTEITKRKYDLYLLCDVDLPWVKDYLREYPDVSVRQKLFLYYKEEMAAQKIPWKVIRGNYEERIADAIKFTNDLLK
jgi:NadR type nicotinamide-nucleotide adenylyltransferase